MRKILFFVFILSLFIFSNSNANAAVTCNVTAIKPGLDSDGKTLDSHTHYADMTIAPQDAGPNQLFATGTKYYVVFIKPTDATILDNDADQTRYVGNGDAKYLTKIIQSVTCEDNGSGYCQFNLHGVDGVGTPGNGVNGTTYLAGDYTVVVASKQNTSDPLCTSTFHVANTYDYGYDNCHIVIEGELNPPDKQYSMNINKDILIHGIFANKDSGEHIDLTIKKGTTDDSYLYFHDVSVGDLKNGHTIKGGIQVPGPYTFDLKWGGSIGGSCQQLGTGECGFAKQCTRGTIYISLPNKQGGPVTTQGRNVCLACKAGNQYIGMNIGTDTPNCQDPNSKETDATKINQPFSVDSCPDSTICAHQEGDPKTVPPTDGVTTGCIPLANGCTSNDCKAPDARTVCSHLSANGQQCASIDTDLGIPIPTDPAGLINALLGVVLSAAGGIAIFLIMLSGYKMMISQGNPEQIKDAREQLTAAIIGLLFVIFSLVILQFIGINVLNLPGFK